MVLGIALEAPSGIPEAAVVGKVPTPDGWAVAYDALWDPETAAALFAEISPDLRVRRVGTPTADGTVVADDRWELRLQRQLADGPVPEIAVPVALGAVGCDVVVAPEAVWRRGSSELGVVRPLRSGPDALGSFAASIAEVLADRRPPTGARGDIGPVAEGLGRAVATLHVGLAAAFGSEPLEPDALVAELVGRLRRLRSASGAADLDLARIESTYRRLAHGTDLGSRIRVHGDLRLHHARQDRDGWFLDGFGDAAGRTAVEDDEPLRSSPLRDVASVLRDVQRVARRALATGVAAVRGDAPDQDDQVDAPRPIDPPERELSVLAEAWEDSATQGFLRGYTSVDEVHRLIPGERLSRDALLVVFEHDLAVHEVAR